MERLSIRTSRRLARPPIARLLSSLTLAVMCGLGALAPSASAGDPDGRKVDFNFQIRPILSDKCFNCHGPDPRIRKAGLRLDLKEGAFGTTPSGARAIVPGNLEDSELYAKITATDEAERMPPKLLGRTLSSKEIELLKRWIAEGAEWQEHWSFRPPVAAPFPAFKDAGWPRSPIDRFILARLDAEDLLPAPQAEKERLIRRLTFDLIGLPPTLDEIDAFLADQAPDAYPRLVDRLLASPRFGERMAVEWLDLARYADTYGYQADVYRATWPWRDWVVQAYNSNLPYDRFITWQLAGDLVPAPSRAQIMATAFNRHHRQTNEGGSIEEEFRVEYVADRTDTFGTAFLGLTLGCARCHSHKYDPISHKEYYQFFSFFDNIDESGLYSHFTQAVPTPALPLTSATTDQAIAAIEAKIKTAEAALDWLAGERMPAFESWLSEPNRSRQPVLTGLIGDFPLDAIAAGKVVNRANVGKPGQASDEPEPVEGKIGRALRLSGENSVTLPLGNFDRFEPFSLALWIKTPDFKDRAVIVHRSMSWTDAGSRGYQVLIEDGKPSAGLIHFWPGNAIGIRARDPLPIGRWVHLAITWDGSSRAAGLALYVDGRRADCEIVRDHLTKNITGGGNDQITVGQRFRDRGFKNGLVDEIKVFDRALTPLEVAQVADQTSLSQALGVEPAKLSESSRRDLLAYYLSSVDVEFKQRTAQLKELRRQRSALVDPIPEIMVMKEKAVRRPTYLLKRGAYDNPGERVAPDTPAALPPFARTWPRNRLGLAQWLTDPKHPLTARVAVNRWWQALFGRGIVATPEDFGSQGQLPSHPELLDWLARTFIDSGWDVKHLVRTIVTSATYCQGTAHFARRSGERPREHSPGPRTTVPAAGGDDPRPDACIGADPGRNDGRPAGQTLSAGGIVGGEIGARLQARRPARGSHRRSLYTYWKRTSPPPAMLTFDATTREFCAVKRQPTATPLQALVLLNDPQFVEASRALAQRAFREGGASLSERIAFVVRTLAGRQPRPREIAILEALYREQCEEFRSGRSDPIKLLQVGDLPRDPAVDAAECAAMTVLAQALLNYDETITKY